LHGLAWRRLLRGGLLYGGFLRGRLLHGWFLSHLLYYRPLHDGFLRLASLLRRFLRDGLPSGLFRWGFLRGRLPSGLFRWGLLRGGLPFNRRLCSLLPPLLLHHLLLDRHFLARRRSGGGRQTFENMKKGLTLSNHAQLQPGAFLDGGETLF
jgi:hypothetical protein